jgi:hypothetical protein
MSISEEVQAAIVKGDWTLLPQTCDGQVEIWDQTIGCAACQMNLWFWPYDENHWPAWDVQNKPTAAWFDTAEYIVQLLKYKNLFDRVHGGREAVDT